ncbi:Uma2 family endonuclease [Nocardiopsis rhodophaea]
MSLAMAEATPDGGFLEADELLRTWLELDVPDGWRAEIVDGKITIMAPPSKPHNFIAHLLHRTLTKAAPDDLGVFQTLGVGIPALGEVYIPDLVVIPEDAVEGDPSNPHPAEDALLVVEIVSKSSAEADRRKKLRGYAHAPVPLYLLIDSWAEEGAASFLYETPKDGAYLKRTTVRFGDPLYLPEPFDLEVDTKRFPRPE